MAYTKSYRRFGSDGIGNANYNREGDYLVFCDISGFPTPASQTKKQWDGLRVRDVFWSRRQPQDFVIARGDRQAVPDPRPEQPSITIDENNDGSIEDVLGS